MEILRALVYIGTGGYVLALLCLLLLTAAIPSLRRLRPVALGLLNRTGIVLAIIAGILGVYEAVLFELEYRLQSEGQFVRRITGFYWYLYRIVGILPLPIGMLALRMRTRPAPATCLILLALNIGWITERAVTSLTPILYRDARPAAWSFDSIDLLPDPVTLGAAAVMLITSLIFARNKAAAIQTKRPHP